MSETLEAVKVMIASGAGYAGKMLLDYWLARRKQLTPEAREASRLSAGVQQLDMLVKLNEELTDEAARLRANALADEERFRASECAWQSREQRWVSERRELQEQIDTMTAQLRNLMAELEDVQRRLSGSA